MDLSTRARDFTNRCCIDGHSPCLGGRIGFLAGPMSIGVLNRHNVVVPSMQLQSLEFLDIVGFLCGTHAET